MNLHSIRSVLPWLWWNAVSGNGRPLGIHLWQSEFLDSQNPPYRGTYWDDSRYNDELIYFVNTPRMAEPNQPGGRYNGGWVRPLCGRRSVSQYPSFQRTYNSRWQTLCEDCLREALHQGLQTLYSQDMDSLIQIDPYRGARQALAEGTGVYRP